MNALFFDTETTGLVKDRLPPTHADQPMPIQLGMKLDNPDRREVGAFNCLIKTEGRWSMHAKAAEITGLSDAMADAYGIDVITAYEAFTDYVAASDVLVAHNARFDITVMRHAGKVYADLLGIAYQDPFEEKKVICTMLASMNIVKATPRRNGQWKWPKLEECMKFFFGLSIDGAHDALVDVRATAKVFYYLVDTGVFQGRHSERING